MADEEGFEEASYTPKKEGADERFHESSYNPKREESGAEKLKKEDLIIEAKNFLDFNKKEIGEKIKREINVNVVFVDFMKLTEFSNKLSDEILSNPEEVLRLVELAIEESGLVNNVRVRLYNLPKSQDMKVRTIRSRNLNELIVVEGIIRQASDVRP